ARRGHAPRAPGDRAHPPVVAAHDAELGGDDDLVAPAADGAPAQLVVGVGAVHVGGVEEGDAEVERAVDGGDRLAVVVRAVELRHPHAAEADGGDGGTEASELSSLDGHAGDLRVWREPREGCYSRARDGARAATEPPGRSRPAPGSRWRRSPRSRSPA